MATAVRRDPDPRRGDDSRSTVDALTHACMLHKHTAGSLIMIPSQRSATARLAPPAPTRSNHCASHARPLAEEGFEGFVLAAEDL